MKRGMTLVETSIAVAVMGIVLSAIGSLFITAHRMLRTAMAEAELSLGARELREKLLFRIMPEVSGIHGVGLLSGTNSSQIVEGSGTVLMQAQAVGNSLNDSRGQSIRLLLWNEQLAGENRYYLINEHTPDKDAHRKWLWPQALSLTERSLADIVDYDSESRGAHERIYRLKFDIGLATKTANPRGEPIVRRERVSVPVFGRIQPFASLADSGEGD